MSKSATQFAFGRRKKWSCAYSKVLNKSAPLLSEEIHYQIWRVRTVNIQTYVFPEQIRKLLLKRHFLIVRVVRVSGQWMFRKVWTFSTKGMFRWRSSWQAWTSVHPVRVFTVGYSIFICKQWGPKHVCTFITRLGMCSRAEIFFIHVLLYYGFAYIIVLFRYDLCGWMSILFILVVYSNYFHLVCFYYFSLCKCLLVISSLEWVYRLTSRVVCSIYRYSGPKNNAYSDKEYSLQEFPLVIHCLNPRWVEMFRNITAHTPVNAIRETFMKSSCTFYHWSRLSGPLDTIMKLIHFF